MRCASGQEAEGSTLSAGLPKAARLLKTDEFSSVFRLRPWYRSQHFVVYGRHTGQPARLGMVVGRKFAARAASRNLVRRLTREMFRLQRGEFAGWDILVRLHRRIDKQAFPSAASPALARLFASELRTVFDKARERAATARFD